MKASHVEYQTATVEVTQVHRRTSQELIEITVDKLSLVLHEQKGLMERRREWQVPAGLCVAILATFLTSQFHAAFGFAAETWAAVFVVIFLLCLVWLIRSLILLFRSPKIEDLVEKIKTCN
jgi:hypothetical protein